MNSNFLAEIDKDKFIGNIVIDVNGVYYSQHQVDNGLIVDSDKVGLVIDASISGSKTDIRNVKSSIANVTFSLLDKDSVISIAIGTDATAWLNYEVKLYYGFITSGFGFGAYELLATTRIKTVSKKANVYTFTASEPMSLLKGVKIYSENSQLDEDLDDSETTIDVLSATGFAATGIIKINDEFISYTGISGNSFTGCTRAQLSSTAAEHDTGDEVLEVTLIEDASMTLAYDIIVNQAGVSSALVDQDSFTDLTAGSFVSDGDYKFYMYDIDDALTWLEENILLSTNTRLFTDPNGKIKIALLDQVAFADTAEQFTESNTIGNPGYKLNIDKVINKIRIKYDYVEGTGKFLTVYEDSDTDSITNFDEKLATYEYKGVHTSLGGADIVENRASTLLLRLANPLAEITTKAFFNKLDVSVADQVYFKNRFIPQPGSGVAFEQMLEVMSRKINNLAKDPTISFNLAFTSYTGSRYCLISSAPLISAVTSQSVFTVPDGGHFKAGYFIRLWDDSAASGDGAYYPDAAIAISSINGNVITMASAFPTTTLTTSVRITFPDFDDMSDDQKLRYGAISDATNEFDDGSLAYSMTI